MARPFASLDTVITSLHVNPGQNVLDLHKSTALSVVQIRRAIWAGRDGGLIRFARPLADAEPTARREYYRYEVSELGEARAVTLAEAAARQARKAS